MRESIKIGLSFGLTSAVITTLGLIMGLYKSTSSEAIIIAGILTIAIADSFSDALGIHMSTESSKRNGRKAIWEATGITFVTKFVIALLFIVPFILFSVKTAIVISVIFGLAVIILFSYRLAVSRHENPLATVSEHVGITILVLVLTWIVGNAISIYLLG